MPPRTTTIGLDPQHAKLDSKPSVRAATVAAWPATRTLNNYAASALGALVIDGVTLVAGERLLLKNQTAGQDNGIVTITNAGSAESAASAARAADAARTGDLTPGTTVRVEEGAFNADRSYGITTDGTITLNTTPIAWAEIGAGGSVAETDPVACNAAVAVGDVIYYDGSGVAQRASAAAGGGQTIDGKCVVTAKPTATTATVIAEGQTPSIFAGLTAGAEYFSSVTAVGGIQTPAPTGAGQKVQRIGIALSASRLFVDVEPSVLI
jgi:hypothetical protein